MPHLPPSRPLMLGLACLTLATIAAPAPADVYFETGYIPTRTVVGVSSPVLPTAYVVPTSLSTTSYLPTSYVTTSSVLATDSVVYPTTTTYYRRSLFRPRRYVERTYSSYYPTASYLTPTTYLATSSLMPTAYVASSSLLPTVYLSSPTIIPSSYVIDRGVVTTSATSSEACETSPMPTRATVSRPSGASQGDSGNTITSSPSTGGTGAERQPRGMINNPQAEDVPAPVVAPVTPIPPKPQPAVAPGTTAADAEQPPAYDPSKANPTGGAAPIIIPPAGESGAGSRPNETSFRSARKPNAYDGRNILRGRVISAESRRPEEGVTVLIANLTKSFADRQAMTDADGEFKVSLPDGDWFVKVKMPSGAVYQVGRDVVTASNGRVMDPSGRLVAEFLISR